MIETLNVRGRINAFHERHGGEAYELDGWLWYRDGAHREAGEPLGLLVEPPSIHSSLTPKRLEYDLAAAKLKFYQAKLAAAVRQFDDLHQRLSVGRPTDEEFALGQLEDLRAIVEARTEEARQAQAVVDATSVGQMRKSAQNRPQLETAKLNGWRDKLKKVKI
jgi:hypothetical protein